MALSKSDIERHYFDQFCKLYPLPACSLVYGDQPDVIAHGNRKIGIEITNFFVQSGALSASEQRQVPLREKAVSDAHSFYLATGGKPVEFTFSFDKRRPLTAARAQTFSLDLAVFARSQDNQQSGLITNQLFQDKLPEVSSIYINSHEYADAKWRIAQVHSVELMSIDALMTIIKEKETKAARYEVCDTYWLLIVVDGMNAAQEQEIRINGLQFNSDIFEKVFLFHTFGHIVQIDCRAG